MAVRHVHFDAHLLAAGDEIEALFLYGNKSR